MDTLLPLYFYTKRCVRCHNANVETSARGHQRLLHTNLNRDTVYVFKTVYCVTPTKDACIVFILLFIRYVKDNLSVISSINRIIASCPHKISPSIRISINIYQLLNFLSDITRVLNVPVLCYLHVCRYTEQCSQC